MPARLVTPSASPHSSDGPPLVEDRLKGMVVPEGGGRLNSSLVAPRPTSLQDPEEEYGIERGSMNRPLSCSSNDGRDATKPGLNISSCAHQQKLPVLILLQKSL